jgi:hypothetical protein
MESLALVVITRGGTRYETDRVSLLLEEGDPVPKLALTHAGRGVTLPAVQVARIELARGEGSQPAGQGVTPLRFHAPPGAVEVLGVPHAKREET